MTQEQYTKAIAINERLEALYSARDELETYYVLNFCDSCEIKIIPGIRGILDRHGQMIRQEIYDEIKKLKQDIEKL
ncbi:MAG: hypothetical protein II670_00950 [Alphaproteobacteria bacterium]|nr:hypothetical protein [Alphaproteobacteria bacterium]